MEKSTFPKNSAESQSSTLDIDTLMATIRQSSQRRQVEAELQGVDLSTFKEETICEEALSNEYRPLLSFLLRELDESSLTRLQIAPEVRASRLDKLPLLGFLWRRLRGQLHGLSIFYANKVAGQIGGRQQRLATVLSLLAQEVEQQEAEIAALKQHLTKMEAELARLEPKE